MKTVLFEPHFSKVASVPAIYTIAEMEREVGFCIIHCRDPKRCHGACIEGA